jgi:hypothetical protein
MDIWDAFARHNAELTQRSVAWDDQTDPYSAEAGSKEARGMVYGRITLTENAFLSVHELIEVVDDDVTRRKYAYYVISDGEPVWGEEFDPAREADAASGPSISLMDAIAEAQRIAGAE